MDPAKATLVKTFADAATADLAAAQLRSRGIECFITSDDCGGMSPPLGVIKLLTDQTTAESAKEILSEAGSTANARGEAQETSGLPERPAPPRVFRFNAGLIVGAILGALLHFTYIKYREHSDGAARYDHDQDGADDVEVIWRNGKTVEARSDRNGDSRVDLWTHFRGDTPSQDEADDDFDGRVDLWSTYTTKGIIGQIALDTDHNGIRDVTMFYTNGVLARADWKPNGTNVVLIRHFYRHGVLSEELRDENGDGQFDVSIQFNAFITPTGTNRLHTPTTATP